MFKEGRFLATHDDEIQERLSYTFGEVAGWLHFAETKNAALLAADVAALVALAGLSRYMRSCDPVGAALLEPVAQLTLAALCALVSFLPQVHLAWQAPTRQPKNTDNLLFYGHVAHYGTRKPPKRSRSNRAAGPVIPPSTRTMQSR
jgi:hypothetical protein